MDPLSQASNALSSIGVTSRTTSKARFLQFRWHSSASFLWSDKYMSISNLATVEKRDSSRHMCACTHTINIYPVSFDTSVPTDRSMAMGISVKTGVESFGMYHLITHTIHRSMGLFCTFTTKIYYPSTEMSRSIFSGQMSPHSLLCFLQTRSHFPCGSK